MGDKQYDAALAEMVDTIQLTLESNLGQRSGPPRRPGKGLLFPASMPTGLLRPRKGFPMRFREVRVRNRPACWAGCVSAWWPSSFFG